jgi:maleate isomerase
VLPGDLQARTDAYADHYPACVKAFGGLKLDAIYIACTGPSYKLGLEGDRALAASLSALAGTPVIHASLAILAALERIGAKRMLLVSPYPAWLTARAEAYWKGAGLELVDVVSLSETFRAYEMSNDEVLVALERLPAIPGVPVVLTGTGMPTVAAIRAARAQRDTVCLSSNLCGAWLALEAAGALAPGSPIKFGLQEA